MCLWLQNFKIKSELEGLSTIWSMMRRATFVWVGTESNIYVWNSETLQPRKTLKGHASSVTCIIPVGPDQVWSCSR